MFVGEAGVLGNGLVGVEVGVDNVDGRGTGNVASFAVDFQGLAWGFRECAGVAVNISEDCPGTGGFDAVLFNGVV